jgi:hypothetical protein
METLEERAARHEARERERDQAERDHQAWLAVKTQKARDLAKSQKAERDAKASVRLRALLGHLREIGTILDSLDSTDQELLIRLGQYVPSFAVVSEHGDDVSTARAVREREMTEFEGRVDLFATLWRTRERLIPMVPATVTVSVVPQEEV